MKNKTIGVAKIGAYFFTFMCMCESQIKSELVRILRFCDFFKSYNDFSVLVFFLKKNKKMKSSSCVVHILSSFCFKKTEKRCKRIKCRCVMFRLAFFAIGFTFFKNLSVAISSNSIIMQRMHDTSPF